jgi:hypothetical protein
MAAAANTGHFAFDLGKGGLTLDTGRSPLVGCELGSKDRFRLGRTDSPV